MHRHHGLTPFLPLHTPSNSLNSGPWRPSLMNLTPLTSAELDQDQGEVSENRKQVEKITTNSTRRKSRALRNRLEENMIWTEGPE